MMLIMLWQTFPLRYGLISKLFVEFKWTFAIVILFIRYYFIYLVVTGA